MEYKLFKELQPGTRFQWSKDTVFKLDPFIRIEDKLPEYNAVNLLTGKLFFFSENSRIIVEK